MLPTITPRALGTSLARLSIRARLSQRRGNRALDMGLGGRGTPDSVRNRTQGCKGSVGVGDRARRRIGSVVNDPATAGDGPGTHLLDGDRAAFRGIVGILTARAAGTVRTSPREVEAGDEYPFGLPIGASRRY